MQSLPAGASEGLTITVTERPLPELPLQLYALMAHSYTVRELCVLLSHSL